MRSSGFALMALFTLLSGCVAQADKVDETVKKEMQRLHIPGMALLILKDDAPVKRTAYGEASLELHVPASPDQVFESGSIGKCFTATLVMQLVQEGKLGLTDPLRKHIKEAPAAWEKITIQNMLGHTSGLKDYALVPGLGLLETWNRRDWFDKMTTLPLDFQPGTAWAYSNSNYWLLGIILERLLGKEFTEIVSERILTPLNMKHSQYARESQVLDQRAAGYLRTPEGLINRPPITAGAGDGGMLNTVDDLAAFERGFRTGKLVKPETVLQMQQPGRLLNGRKTPYGLGWFVRTVYERRIVSHGGNTAGFSASISSWPDYHVVVVLMCNVDDVSGDDLARRIGEAYAPELAPKPLTESPDPDPALTKRLSEILTNLAKGQTAQESFDPDYTARLATPRGRMGLAQFNPFRMIDTIAYLHTEADDPDHILRYRVHTGGKSYIVAFVLTKENRIYQIGTREETT